MYVIIAIDMCTMSPIVVCRLWFIRTHMQDLKDVTNNVHYENFRYGRLAFISADGKPSGNNET